MTGSTVEEEEGDMWEVKRSNQRFEPYGKTLF